MILSSCTPQNKLEHNELKDSEALRSQAEKDWKEIDKLKNTLTFFKDSSERETYEHGSFWSRRSFEDDLYKDRSSLIERFLEKYPPENEHYFEGLKIYFNLLFEPRFLKDTINGTRKSILTQKTKVSKTDKSQMYTKFRALPFDIEARERWVKKGDALVQDFLNSDVSMDDKAMIEFAVLCRDARRLAFLYQYLYLDKKAEESEYWYLFDTNYWNEIVNRMELLIFKYPNYPKWPLFLDRFISFITSDYLSPNLTLPYWKHFYDVTKNSEEGDKHKVLREIHIKAKKNLQALKALQRFDMNKPLDMRLLSMDGKVINLNDLRGKVVLLDFWSIRCAPCIKEMPHIRALYNKYKDKGFEVIGIPQEGDSEKQQVLDIINKQGANWPQQLDGASNVEVSYHSLFKINALPTVWLLDKRGVIVDKNARGTRLEPLIRTYLELDK